MYYVHFYYHAEDPLSGKGLPYSGWIQWPDKLNKLQAICEA